jgi:periplasmic divalent cation tolerance protein
MKFAAVYITASSIKEARSLGRKIIENRLAGCVNIVPKALSIYEWNGRIEEQNEALIIAKTKYSATKKLVSFVKKNHSYDVPCITVLPICAGNTDYLKWVGKQVK